MPPDATTPTRTPAVGPAALVAFAMPGLVALTALTALVALGGACTGEAAPATSSGGAGGSGGGGGGGAGGAGGGGGGVVVPRSCRDHRIHWQELGPPWTSGYPLWNARWIHRGKLYLGTHFFRPSEAEPTTGAHQDLGVHVLDVATGDRSVTFLRLIPENVGLFQGDIYAAGSSPDGTFLVVYSHVTETSGGVSKLFYALGKLDDPERTMDLGELFPQLYLPTRVTWDGEAFQVHGENGATVAVARVSTSGEVLLPKTDFGVSWNPGYGPLGYRLEYEPVTELTWIWDGDGAGSGLVQAHDKLGAPLFPYPGVVVEPVHTVAQTGRNGMAAHPGGLDLFWTELLMPKPSAQVGARLGLDGSVTDVFTFEHTFEHQNGEQSNNGFHASAVYRRADGSTWAVGVDQYGARLFTLDYEAGAAALSPRFYDPLAASTPSLAAPSSARR
jgi:hypothetical protein